MVDNKGQTIFLSVIGIATLLVAIIGATFAYFTTQVNSDNVSGGSTEGTTAKISGTTLTFQKNGEQTHDYLDYPGGIGVFGTVAKFVKDNPEEDKNNYTATFDLEIDYNNLTGTALGYTLYMLENAKAEQSLNPNCKLMTFVEGTNTYLWYGNQNDEVTAFENIEDSQCTFDGGDLDVFADATTIASGTLEASQPAGKIDASTKVGEGRIDLAPHGVEYPLKGRQLDTQEGGTSTKYYYLVVEYPNEGDQSVDATGKQISVSLKVTEGSVKVDQGTISE